MKKIFASALALVLSTAAFAQFEQGTNYVATSLSGLDLSYSHDSRWNLGVDAKAGHFVADEWLLHATVGYEFQHAKHQENVNNFQLGAGFRYYIRQNGLSLGAGLLFEHMNQNDFNSIALCPEVAYTFFISKYLTIEPSVYYNLSLNKFSDCSRFGLRVGLGYYFKSRSKKNPIIAQ